MKVLYCNPSFWEYRLPFYVELNRLFNGNFHVLYSTRYFMSKHRKLLDEIKKALGDNAHPYDNETVFDFKTRSFSKHQEGDKSIPVPTALWGMISKIKPDVLITEGFFQWTPIVQLYGLVHHVPVFMGYERTLHTERNNSKFKTFTRKIQDKLFRGYLVNGSETKKYLESIGVAPKKIFIGGMSADSEGLRKAIAAFPEKERKAFKAHFMKSKEGLVFLFSGRVESLKGAPHLLEAWKEHIKKYPNDTIILIGMGDAYDRLKHEFYSCNSVFLEGRIEYDQVYKYYSIADVFILPTLQDNWSLVIPEAMSCGLPVATSIYNGCHPELIHEGENGITFDTFNQESMVKALDYFHHQDLKAMGRKSIELEKPFNTVNCARREFDAIVKMTKQKA